MNIGPIVSILKQFITESTPHANKMFQPSLQNGERNQMNIGPIVSILKQFITESTPHAKKMFQPSLQKRLETDQRKPVLLLRSFKWDNAIVERDFLWGNRTLEEKLTKVLKEIGPVIALGSPKDILRPVGAARTYDDSDKDRWTEVIKELLAMAQLYIAILDFTESLEWELNYVKDQGYLDKLFIIFPWWLLWEDRKQWMNSYNEARKRVKFLPPFKKSILGVWYGGTDEHTLITSNAGTDSTEEYIECITEFLQKTI